MLPCHACRLPGSDTPAGYVPCMLWSGQPPKGMVPCAQSHHHTVGDCCSTLHWHREQGPHTTFCNEDPCCLGTGRWSTVVRDAVTYIGVRACILTHVQPHLRCTLPGQYTLCTWVPQVTRCCDE
jgi:hypothetical protein